MSQVQTPSPRADLLSIPNQLSASRILLAMLLFIAIHFAWWLACLAIFVVAIVTDWLDGYLARRWGMVSSLGRMLDPLADKVITNGAFIFLLPYGMTEGWMQPWMVTLVVARELIITGLRGYMEEQGVSFGADWLGKLKMVLQCAALVAVFVALDLHTRQEASAFVWLPDILRTALIYGMLAATALSGIQYVGRAAMLLRRDATK